MKLHLGCGKRDFGSEWINIDGGDLTVSTTTFDLVNTTATTVNFAGSMADSRYVVAGTATYPYDNQVINNLIVAVPRVNNAQIAGSCRLVAEYLHAAGVYDAVALRAVFFR